MYNSASERLWTKAWPTGHNKFGEVVGQTVSLESKVVQVAAAMAADANKDGLQGQIDFLIQHIGENETEKIIDSKIKDMNT